MDKKIKKVDPIRDNYFSTAEKADKFSEKLFYVGFIFSILVLMIDKNKYANLYDLIFYLFPVVVTAAFSVNLTCRFYLLPKASDKRALDFFSHVFDVELSSEKTIGYYNNDFKEPVDKTAAALLENSFHTKSICQKMAMRERSITAAALAIWLLCFVYRKTDLEMLTVITQVVFGEQLASKCIRIEWLKCRAERIFDDAYKAIKNRSDSKIYDAIIFENLLIYETAKAYSGVILSSLIFDENRIKLAKKWELIQKDISR